MLLRKERTVYGCLLNIKKTVNRGRHGEPLECKIGRGRFRSLTSQQPWVWPSIVRLYEPLLWKKVSRVPPPKGRTRLIGAEIDVDGKP